LRPRRKPDPGRARGSGRPRCALGGILKPPTHADPAAISARQRACSMYVLGPVLGVDVVAKRSQGGVKCEDRLSHGKDRSCSFPLATTPRPRLHDSSENENRLGPPPSDSDCDSDPGGGRGGARPGSRARSSGALAASMQREGAVPDSCVQNEMRRASHLSTK
jgi:hypothetical protein